MITSNDRSYYIGASDTNYVVGNWKTKTFKKWWLEKLALHKNTFTNKYMNAGTNWESKILDFIGAEQRDLQRIIGRLRVNIDGMTGNKIQEVKTYKLENGFRVSKQYRNQCQVEMLAFDTQECEIIAYGLEPKDYENYFRSVDPERLSIYKIDYDAEWLQNEYMPKFEYLEQCLIEGIFPRKGGLKL